MIIEFSLLPPCAQRFFFVLSPQLHPRASWQFRFHFECQFQASGAISWEAEAWDGLGKLTDVAVQRLSPRLHVLSQALAVKGSVLAESTLQSRLENLERSPGLMPHFIQPIPTYMLDHVGSYWELLFHLVFFLCH